MTENKFQYLVIEKNLVMNTEHLSVYFVQCIAYVTQELIRLTYFLKKKNKSIVPTLVLWL